MKMMKLTTPDGRSFEIDPSTITLLEEAQQGGMWAAGVKSIVGVGPDMIKQGVRETVDFIHKLQEQMK